MPTIDWDGDDDFSRAKDNSGFVQDDLADHPAGMGRGYNVGSLTEGLVAYYPMEKGQGEVLLDGATGNHGQINGATWNGSGQVGSNALSFDGTDDYVECADGILPDDSRNPLSISFWTLDNNDGYIVANQNTSSFAGIRCRLNPNVDDLRLQLYDGSNTLQINYPTSSLTDGSWDSVVFTYDGSQSPSGISCFVNGSSLSASSTTDNGINNDIASNEAMEIGRRPDGTVPYQGVLDDVRIYDRALSQPEIEALSNLTAPSGREVTEADVPTQSDSGVSRYEFENDVTDSWGTNDGTDNTSAGFVDGVYGQAKDFDGTDDGIDTGFQSLTPPLTISAWAYIDDKNSDHAILTNFNSTSDDFMLHYNDFGDDWNLQYDAGAGVNGSITPASQEWTHVVATVSASESRLYVNGRLDNSESNSSTATIDNGSTFRVGRDPEGSFHFKGAIDDVRIYDDTLSPSEVEQLYNKGAYRINRGDVL